MGISNLRLFKNINENEKINYELRNCIQKNLLNAKPYSEVLEAEKLVERVKKDLEEFISKRTNNKVKVKARKEVIKNTTS